MSPKKGPEELGSAPTRAKEFIRTRTPEASKKKQDQRTKVAQAMEQDDKISYRKPVVLSGDTPPRNPNRDTEEDWGPRQNQTPYRPKNDVKTQSVVDYRPCKTRI
ncbi:hypothetical protein AVEN_174363-1 [Araneus ventricosus]|uniref:Uncharacterized protein n=1 Tax=Araneus ventricosus TaxID=182803 RepID=A0A4Y2UD23_ARAVE|nr:hypothetical protein AVEN_174363-1 [Araneus ventricosus]